MYTKEQLVGRKFTAHGVEYTIVKVEEGKVYLWWEGSQLAGRNHDSGNCTLEQVNTYFENGAWKLLPEKSKMKQRYVLGGPIFEPPKFCNSGINVNQVEEIIEVGDTVEFKDTGKLFLVRRIIDSNTFKASTINNNVAELYEVECLVSDNRLVSKAKKQEIVGYELLKDLPGIPAGSKTIKKGKAYYYFGDDLQYRTKDLQDTTWFKPIYKVKEVVVKISENREVKLTDKRVILPGVGGISLEDLDELVRHFNIPNKEGRFSVTITRFRIGCQEFTKRDIELVYQATQKLNN